MCKEASVKIYCIENENYNAVDYYNEPSGDIVELIKNIGNNETLNILDLGSGIGRHSIYCAKKGHQVTAVDYSSQFLNILKYTAEFNNLEIRVKVADFRKKLFKENQFDLIICYNSIYHGNKEAFEKCINYCYEYLKEGGLLVFTCPSPKDYKYGQGIKIDHLTYQSNHEVHGKSIRFFPTKEILIDNLDPFKNVRININNGTLRNRNGEINSSYWYIEAQK